jgi:methyl-accepting chemotaxis protein
MSPDSVDNSSGSSGPDPTTMGLLAQGLDRIPVPMHVIGTDYRILYTNEAAATLLGKKRDDIIGKKCSDLYRSPNCNTPDCPCRIAMEKGINYSVEITMGDVVINVTGAPLTDSSGKVIGAIEYFPEVTEQKKAVADILNVTEKVEKEDFSARTDPAFHTGDFKKMADGINNLLDIFVAKNNWYKAIIDAVPFPIHVTDMDMKWTLMNAAFEKTLIEQGTIKDRDSSMGLPCSTANATICNTDGCGIRQLHKGVTESYFVWGEMNGKQTTSSLRDQKGNQIGYVEVVQDLTSVIAVRDFTKAEVDRMATNLALLAEGNLNFDLAVKPADAFTKVEHDEFVKMNENLQRVQQAIGAVIDDGILLTESTGKGELSVRADASRHKGDFRRIIEGFNQTLEELIPRLRTISGAVNKIGKGVIPEKLTAETYGEFIDLRDNLNSCIDGLGGLVEANATLQRMDNNDHSRGMEGNYLGLFGEVKVHVNAVRDRVNTLADSVEKIGKGDFSDYEMYRSIGKRSEQDRLVPGFIRTLEHLRTLTEDTQLLSRAAVEGRLGTRADASRHEGDYRKIVEGINQTLDAVIAPLTIGADYIAKISAGVAPEKTTKEYMGDFKVLMGNLNHLVDVMVMRNADLEMLIQAAIEGKLTTRVDSSKFEGGNRKMMDGINSLLDAINKPVNEAMRISDEFAHYNFTARFDPNVKVAGDFVRFKNALDSVGIAVTNAVGAINIQVTDLAASAEEAAASVEEVVSGAQQVADNAGKVSSNAEKGNLGLEQVLKAMEDLSAAVEEVTASTESVATLANGANTLSKDGAELARKAEQGMVGITRSTTEVDQIIVEIKAEMDKIGKIVGLISDLASQTNLLALNAAIEAARAGDAGRGFAVVAAEVKSLAQESRTSAESIAEMIGGLKTKSEKAALATASASKEVSEGSAALSETLNVFNKIVADVEKITRSVEEVASASEEQAATVEEITASVHEVGSLVEGTASEAGDAAAASEETSAAIDEVRKIVENVNMIADTVAREMSKFTV